MLYCISIYRYMNKYEYNPKFNLFQKFDLKNDLTYRLITCRDVYFKCLFLFIGMIMIFD